MTYWLRVNNYKLVDSAVTDLVQSESALSSNCEQKRTPHMNQAP
jgi:hypothetical protein